MYKILLVDDEMPIRDAIGKIIKWNELGYELMGTCKDGKEAISMIEEARPDLVITDICMPYVNGIELSKYIYENDPTIKVIVLSGYDEFEYAKQAVKYQVLEYVLKPVTAAEFTETLLKVKETLDKEAAKNINIDRIRSAYANNLPVLRGRFLNSIITSASDSSKIGSSIEEYHLNLSGPYFCCAIIDGDDFSLFSTQEDVGTTLGEFAILNVSEEIMRKHNGGEAFQNQSNQTVLIFSYETSAGLAALTDAVAYEIRSFIADFLKVTVSIGIGKKVHTLHKLPLSYQNALALLEYRFLLGGDRILHSDEYLGKTPEFTINRSEWIDKIIFAIKSDDRKELAVLVCSFIQAIRDALLPKNRIFIIIQNLILSVMNLLESTGIQSSNIAETEKDLLTLIYSQQQLSDIERLLLDFCCQAADAMYSEKEGYGKKQAMLALDYIDKNYGDSDITLNTICSYLSISTSYFSMIFKNCTEETFIESLTKKRIESAKNLIENTSMKTYEISNAVGFSDPHYFSITFKKHTGLTPTEYAKSKRPHT